MDKLERNMKIGKHHIHDESDCYVIAEIGHNHQGEYEKAKEMIHVAKDCGVDAVKFQKRDNRSLFTKSFFDKPYDNEFSYGSTYGLHREALELSNEEFKELRHYADELDIDFMATAFDHKSADFLAEIGVAGIKMASGDLSSVPLLKYVARLGIPMIISTGGAKIEDVHLAYDTIAPENKNFSILQCTAAYPPDFDQLDLNVITTYRELFPDVVIGLSDHSNGIAMGPVSYVLGARVVEKHFTLNRALKGTDHAFSIEPVGLRKLVRDLKRTRVALGSPHKNIHATERNPIIKMSKKIVASRNLSAGTVITQEDLAFKSPGDGLAPSAIDRVVGKTLVKDIQADDDIILEIIK